MGRIQSSVGLITNIPIEDTVNKLMELAAQPKNLLTNRTNLLDSERLAITQLSTLMVAFQFETTQLGKATLFDTRQVSSSDSTALVATLADGGSPAIGNYLFTPVQTALAQQFVSQSFAAEQVLGAGSFSFQTGGFLDKGISLDQFNNGAGVQRGKIRVTDRSGATSVIDLTFARTVDDVLRAISEDTTINVSALAVGDTIKLVDHTGGAGNLSVQNVAGGTTANDLGLASINVAASEATGNDVFKLHTGTKLTTLNDGNGVRLTSGNDIQVNVADGSTVSIDLGNALTLGDVLSAINAASPAKLSAAIDADGNRLTLTDLTSGGGTFAASSVGTGTAAKDLGLTTTAAGGTITGRRLVSGLRDTLVSSLKGGQGLGTLGTINITNRNNVSSVVNLAGVETLSGIIDAINAQATGVTAQLNTARNGIVLNDTTGATASNFIVANGDANNSAAALGLVLDAAVTSVNGGPLHRRTVSEATLLSSLNGGKGIDVGDFKITNSAGNVGAVDLDPKDNVATTVGDVIDRINALTIGVEARINDTGDGIVLVNTADGIGKLTVAEVGNGTTAKDLRILGTAPVGTPQKIDGKAIATVTLDADDKLADAVTKINELSAGVTASVLNDGTGQRLALTASESGEAHALLFDTSNSPFALDEITRAQDALLNYGSTGSTGGGILLSSATNEFSNVIDGVDLTLAAGTLEPVTVSVSASTTAVVDAIQEFVDAYNSLRDALDELTAFNAEDETTGILFGTREALRVDSDLTTLLTSRFFGAGDFESLEAVGISLDAAGQMSLDKTKLTAAYNGNHAALKQFFTDKDLGVAAKLDAVIERLSGVDNSLLSTRAATLADNIETNSERITAMDERLARQRERLLLQFYQLETLVAELQTGLNALSALQPIPPLTSSR